MTDEKISNIKYRLSDLGVKVGELAIDYINEIEKENAKLKEIASRSGYRIAELKHEVDDLKTLHEGDQRAIEAIMMQWKAVNDINTRMKCCGNCKKERNKPEPLAVHVSCTKCKDYSEWELAE